MSTIQERVEALATKKVYKPIDRDTFCEWYNRYADRECTIDDVANACGVSWEYASTLIYATAFGYPLPKYQFTDEWTDETRQELKEYFHNNANHAREVRLARLAKEKAENGK